MINDQVADMLTRIRNASNRGLEKIELPYSKMKESAAKILESEEYIGKVSSFKPKDSEFKKLSIELKYDQNGNALFSKLLKVSKPGLKVYSQAKDIRPVLSGIGMYVVSTSRGVMSSKEARKKKLGGEIICEVY